MPMTPAELRTAAARVNTRALLAALDRERLRRQRDSNGRPTQPWVAYTWKRLATEAGVNTSAFTRLRQGRCFAPDLAKLCGWLGTTPSTYLITDQES